jgi:hypothetical protein
MPRVEGMAHQVAPQRLEEKAELDIQANEALHGRLPGYCPAP